MISMNFWENKKVFITGHTGFKGSWLCMILTKYGAHVYGYALEPPTEPSLYSLCKVETKIKRSFIGDIRDYNKLDEALTSVEPNIIIHMAAQPLVRDSYKNPVDTYSINVMGTVNLLEIARKLTQLKVIINVTTDKCYDNKEWEWGYRETEPLGGFDPYSSSKACSELVTSAYRESFFSGHTSVAIATARAGNVIGGGDWAEDRLLPDCFRSLTNSVPIKIRNPHSIRPWQHVIEPLSGYLLLAQNLYEDGREFIGAWNFGPNEVDTKPVSWIVQKLCDMWAEGSTYIVDNTSQPHEAKYLKLDISKAKSRLKWQPRWSLEIALEKILEWNKAYKNDKDMAEVCFQQIEDYFK
ncbi:CDP-glucose 4,6-dehydratase [Paenibacillus oryzisoli]|uniref:CDP-glucose 4,6-dehydratase n=1 Tax=Paenibacillus oryzisoli TaxID=1850517 RepID=UPI003D2A292D